jgi:hypothetical protein
MNQEEINHNAISGSVSEFDSSEENSDTKNQSASTDASPKANSDEAIDNLPIESIGSYGRVDELLTDEEAENSR